MRFDEGWGECDKAGKARYLGNSRRARAEQRPGRGRKEISGRTRVQAGLGLTELG